VAVVAVAPLQDVLGLGSEARMNTPASAEGNWAWRFREGALTAELAARLREMTATYGRL
jgi:4-alpha-glucanotransferase